VTLYAPTDPALVTLEAARIHLRITDVDHDVDIQAKVTAASATIRDYLKDKNDPTWTPDTVPPWIASAVFLLLAHLYEHRGDEFGPAQDNDDRVWEAIANLCRRSRDPALA
jgi:Phage gp6-like head-tail connector protein